jgi:SEC-C motif-containing protein
MRSRYSAFAKGEIDYLVKTIPLLDRKGFDKKGSAQWSESAEWTGLEIVEAKDSAGGKKASVEFIASFSQDGTAYTHHEIARFNRVGERWFYVDGKVLPTESDSEIEEPNEAIPSRNGPCSCGSGKKYKRCCGM